MYQYHIPIPRQSALFNTTIQCINNITSSTIHFTMKLPKSPNPNSLNSNFVKCTFKQTYQIVTIFQTQYVCPSHFVQRFRLGRKGKQKGRNTVNRFYISNWRIVSKIRIFRLLKVVVIIIIIIGVMIDRPSWIFASVISLKTVQGITQSWVRQFNI